MGGVALRAVGSRVGIACLFALASFLPTQFLTAQSITAGALRGIVHAADEPLPGASITIEDQRGATVRELSSGDAGGFAYSMMLPGSYNVLVELAGYQPVRIRGVVIASGRITNLSVELVERPPPITSVTELTQGGTSSGPVGRVVLDREIRSFDLRDDATGLGSGIAGVIAPIDGRGGFAQAASGLPDRMSRLVVDGIPELLMRHPGVRGEPAQALAFPRVAIGQAQVSGAGLDTEWRGNPGQLVSFITRTGTNRLEFSPYARGSSAKLGGRTDLNPADLKGTSFSGGFSLSGPIKRDTSSFSLAGSFQSMETPSPFPWEQDGGTLGGNPVSLREAIPQVAQDSHGTTLAGATSPVLRTWKGGSGLGRVDWRVGRSADLMIRVSAGSSVEKNPQLGSDIGNDAGSELRSRDVSTAMSFTSQGRIENEFRAGLSLVRRDWRVEDLPATRLVGEGIRFGGNPVLPGLFQTQRLTVADAAQRRNRNHLIKGGLSLDYTSYRQQYHYGSAGVFHFGDLDHFQSGEGTFFQSLATNSDISFGSFELGLFLQDTWQASPGLDILLGLRYDVQILPKARIQRSPEWFTATGVINDSVPRDMRGIQPRVGFVHNPGGRGDWIVQGGVGYYASGLDLATFAEAVQSSGSNLKAVRGIGTFSEWPARPGSPATSDEWVRLTMFSDVGRYRTPRSFKGDFSITRSMSGGVALQLSSAYRHTDYLLRRNDLNLATSRGEDQNGRPVFGALVQQGGLVSVEPGTSRAFPGFDLASVLSSTGFSDYYEVAASLTRPISRSIAFTAEYIFSRTRDNLVGLLQSDPADQLSPFPGGIDGVDWDEATSDLDVPHRAAAILELNRDGMISLAARARWRSGLPFTPGFRSGVDLNGDLGGNNDPAPADGGINPSGPGVVATCTGATVAGFVARNSCRERSVGSLDFRLGVAMPFGSTRRVRLTLDVFNAISSKVGLVDRAVLLIDPSRNLSIDPGTGAVSIPFVSNPAFGTLLRRFGEPRLFRLGLQVE